MRRALALITVALAALFLAFSLFGFGSAYQFAYMTITVWAALISFTFAWLGIRRRSDFAIGMAMSWAGTAYVQGWWYLANTLSQDWMKSSPLLFVGLALYMGGATWHFMAFENAAERRGLAVASMGVPLSAIVIHLILGAP